MGLVMSFQCAPLIERLVADFTAEWTGACMNQHVSIAIAALTEFFLTYIALISTFRLSVLYSSNLLPLLLCCCMLLFKIQWLSLQHTQQDFYCITVYMGAKSVWDFWISDLVKNLDGTDI